MPYIEVQPTLHRDGTVTYWSVYDQRWVKRVRLVPDRECAAWPIEQYNRYQDHLRDHPEPTP